VSISKHIAALSTPAALSIALAFSSAAQAPVLSIHDVTLGTQATAPASFPYPPNHSISYGLTGTPGTFGFLAISFSPPPTPAIPLGSGVLAVDPANMFLLLSGVFMPASGGQSLADLAPPLPVGTTIYMQAATFDAASGNLLLSAGLELAAGTEPFTTIAQGTKTQIPPFAGPPGQALISNQAQWQAFWASHSSLQPLPSVDFAQHAVLAVWHGFAPSTGHHLAVQSVSTGPQGLAVEVLYSQPLTCGAFFQQTAPFHFVSIPAAVVAPIASYHETIGDSCL
jgi:hypothetical protein